MSAQLRNSCRARAAGALLVACVGVALFAVALPGPFVLDDQRHLVENSAIRMSELSVEGLWRAATESPSPRPLANALFALEHSLGAEEARDHRLANIAIHVLNGWLVYALGLALTRRLSQLPGQREPALAGNALALLAALVFVAHPIQTQSVTYVVQRMTSLCTTFYLGALLAYLLGRARTGAPRIALFAVGGVAWLAALLTKQIAATLPLVVLLVEWLFLQDLSRAWLRRHARWLAALAVCGALAVAGFLAVTPAALDYSARDFTLTERVWTQLRVVVFYASLLVFPAPGRLNLTHDFPTSHGLFDPPSTFVCGLLLLALFALAVRLAPRQRLVSFCVLWFFVHLAIESSVIPLEMVFEHRLYLPMVGVSWLVALGCLRLAAWRPALGWGVAVAVLVALSLATFERNRTWRDPVTLWSDVVAKSPGNARAHNNLGGSLARAGRVEEALPYFAEALRIDPGYFGAAINVAMAFDRLGRDDEALAQAEQVVRLAPDDPWARYILGNMHARRGHLEPAVTHLGTAARLDEQDALARFELSGALIRMGRFDEAEAPLVESVRLDPTFAPAHAALGGLYAQLGRPEEARRHLEEALRLEPGLRGVREVLERLDAEHPDP